MNSLDNCINYLLTGAQHSVFQYMKKNLAQFDITPIQYGVLGCIWEFDMHNPKDIAAHLGVENSTISGILERMENKGLIRRMIDSTDRRFIHIELTEVSRNLEVPVRTVVAEVDRVVLKQFDEKEIEILKNMLRRMYRGKAVRTPKGGPAARQAVGSTRLKSCEASQGES